MQLRKLLFLRCDSGQALVEAALMLPVLLVIILNAVNFGYFFLVALNVAAAPRSGVEYSVLGFSSGGALTLPPAGTASTTTSVSYLAYQDMNGALYSSSNTPVRVCSKTIGLTNPGTTSQIAQCSSFGNAASPAFATPIPADPEAPTFVLHRVDVQYVFTPLIPGTLFGLTFMASPICTTSGGTVSCTFHRQVSMRALD